MRYQDLILSELPGLFPREKHESLMEILCFLKAIAYPRRGTDEESWSSEEMAQYAKIFIEQDRDYRVE